MPTYYNLSLIQNSTSIVELGQGQTAMLGGLFIGWIILVIIAFSTFATLKGRGYFTATCFAVTAWLTTLSAWVMRAMQWIDNYTLWFCVVLSIGSIGFLYLSDNPG